VPRRGPVILASNHLSFSDHFFGPLPLPRKVIFLGKAEYFTGRGLKGLLSKIFFTGVGVIPVDRGGGEASERAIRTSLRVLAAGNVLGILDIAGDAGQRPSTYSNFQFTLFLQLRML
jgi:1-acyl-sn-glycerol-3-phosphate acyltransferase